ncbi:MAG TPA: GntR family transcriptional regulator [Chthonomonadaceae bacterium]|nr:GntR family transcriptional regulator [Chthonomonadaceae bacterium]
MTKEKTISTSPAVPQRTLRYEQAKNTVERYIHRNRLKPGDRLPTEAQLQAQYGWSRVTINRALNELVWAGVLTRVQGSGTYVAHPRHSNRTFRVMVSARPYEAQDDYCNPLFAGIREEAATQQTVHIVYYSEQPVPDPETVYRLGADGVLALSWELDDLFAVQRLHQAGIPVVGLALRSRLAPLPLVYADNHSGMEVATRHLLDHGHRRIGFVSMGIENSDGFERLLGFHAALAQAGVTVDPSLLLVGNTALEDALLETWWRHLRPKPTALLLHGILAAAMLSVVERAGIAIPGDLSIIVIDEMQVTQRFTPPLTVLRQSPYELGRRGLNKLVRMCCGEDDGLPEMLPTELIPRQSVAMPKEVTAP